MKGLRFLAAIALALCLTACVKNDGEGTVTVNDATYTNVSVTCDSSHGGLYLIFDLGDGITGTGLVDARLALEKTLKFGEEEGNGGYGDWIALCVEYPNGKIYNAVPKTGTQTIKKKGKSYSIVIDGKDENDKAYKMNVTATEK